MWDINLKAINKQDKQTETQGHGQWTSGYQRVGGSGRKGEVDRVKGVKYRGVDGVKGIKYMVAEGNWTLGGNHTIEYIDVK